MKKNVWIKLILLFVTGCLLTSDSPGSAQDSTSTLPTTFAGTPFAPAQIYRTLTVSPGLTELDQVEDTGHFTIHYSSDDQESAGYIGIALEDNLERVCTDLAHCPQQKIELFI